VGRKKAEVTGHHIVRIQTAKDGVTGFGDGRLYIPKTILD
jgi:hypothetical protein